MSRHFDENMIILISHFLCFVELNFHTDYYVVIKNKYNYIFKTKPKKLMFWSNLYFYNNFPTACFPNSFEQVYVQMAYDISANKWFTKHWLILIGIDMWIPKVHINNKPPKVKIHV